VQLYEAGAHPLPLGRHQHVDDAGVAIVPNAVVHQGDWAGYHAAGAGVEKRGHFFLLEAGHAIRGQVDAGQQGLPGPPTRSRYCMELSFMPR
jgi:hypothetical protein